MSGIQTWIPIYIGDYLADTARLTTEQHGAYLLLIFDYWRSGPLSDNDIELASITKLSPDAWLRWRPSLERFFTIKDGVWRHKRVDEEIERARSFHESRRKNGLKGGRPRKPTDNLLESTRLSVAKPTDNLVGNLRETPARVKVKVKVPTKEKGSHRTKGEVVKLADFGGTK